VTLRQPVPAVLASHLFCFQRKSEVSAARVPDVSFFVISSLSDLHLFGLGSVDDTEFDLAIWVMAILSTITSLRESYKVTSSSLRRT
jgi:hypothetical protein